MSIKDFIKSITQIDKSKQVPMNLTWSEIVVQKPLIKQSTATGEKPFSLVRQ
jgi:hypothetical protein